MVNFTKPIGVVMRSLLALLISLCIALPGCMDSVNDTVNPEQELFDDNTFVNEDEHIKLTWTIESASTIRIDLELSLIHISEPTRRM